MSRIATYLAVVAATTTRLRRRRLKNEAGVGTETAIGEGAGARRGAEVVIGGVERHWRGCLSRRVY